MHTQAEIREATRRDMDGVQRVCLAAHAEYAEVLEPAAWEKLESGISGVAKLAETGTIIVAEEPEPGWATIRMLSVHPDYRGRGLGRLLSEQCLARARGDGAERVALHTGEQMAAARRLYTEMGFKVLREIEPRFGFRYWICTRRP